MDQTFQSFYYTHMMWAGSFSEESWINGTLFSFDPVVANPTGNATINATNAAIEMQRSAIANDTMYGFGTEGNMTIWVAATMGAEESMTNIRNHWFSGVYQISDAWYANLTNSDSQIQAYINSSNTQLALLGYFNASDINNKNMWAQQWAKGDLLNNTALCVNPNACQNVTSVMDIGMSFLTQPEITQSGCDVNFTREDGLELFDQDLEGSFPAKTFLAAENYFAF